ncbi:hypothetical protein LEN26_020802 [Aphanomyces euteiches]|nr:hypothetical protein LEN26_020802 [Aphanomyces euteiches]
MLKHYLTDAKNKLKDEAYEAALEASTKALELDGMNFNALMLKGKSLYHLQNAKLAEETYRRAVDLQPDTPLVWKGLLELFELTQEHAKSIEPLEKLRAILIKNDKWDRCQKVTSDLAQAATLAGQIPKALETWYPLVLSDPRSPALFLGEHPNEETPSEVEIWISVLRIAQAHRVVGPFKSLDLILDNIVRLVPSLSWSPEDSTSLHSDVVAAIDIAVDNAWRTLKTAPGNEKSQARRVLDELCARLVAECPRAKRAAEVRLIRHEDMDGELSAEDFNLSAPMVKELAPKSSLVAILTGLEQYKAGRPLEALANLSQGIIAVPEHIEARVVLARLSLEEATFDPVRCLDMIHSSQDAAQTRYDTLGTSPNCYSDTEMNLLQARALIAQSKWHDAIMVYEGVVEHEPFLAEAVIGLAEAHLHLGEVDAASLNLQFLPPQPSSAAYFAAKGWLSYCQGDLKTAQTTLEAGLNCADVAWTLKYRLARVYWDLGGDHKTNKVFCVAMLLGAAKLNPREAGIFSMLGSWYRTIASDNVRAEKCFLKALSLDPSCEVAGLTLTEMYTAHGEDARVVQLWSDNAASQVHAAWAWERLAQYQLSHDDEAAIGNMHKLLRNAPGNASYWAALGHVYQVFGRIVAAQKSYMKALDLAPNTPNVLCELARIELSLGLLDEALGHLTAIESPNAAVNKLHAETLFTQAKALCAQGLYGRSLAQLHQASHVLTTCVATERHPCLYKLLGDIHMFAFYLPPTEDLLAFLSQGSDAYAKVLADQPDDPVALFDAGISQWILAQAKGFLHHFPVTKWSLDHNPIYPEAMKCHVDLARSHLTKSLSINPNDAKVWNAFGAVSGSVALKQFAFVRAIELENLDAAWANLGMLYLHSGLFAMAQKAYLSLQGVNPNHPAMWLGYGLLGCRKNTFADAHAAYTCAIELRLDLDILHGFAYTALISRTGSLDQALFALKKFAERDGYHAAATNSLGVALMRTGLYGQAIDAFEKALDRVQDTVTRDGILLNLAQAQVHQKQFGAAQANLKKRSTPHNLLQAQIHLGRGEHENALALIQSDEFVDNVNVLLAQQVIMYQLGQRESCRRNLEALLSQFPSEEVAKTLLALYGLDWWQSKKQTILQSLCAPLVDLYISRHDHLGVKRICDSWTSEFPQDPEGYLARARAKLAFGDLEVDLSKVPSARLPFEAQLHRMQIESAVQLFTSWNSSDTACRKWLHLNPADPLAPLVVAIGMLKRFVKNPSDLSIVTRAKQWLARHPPQSDSPYSTWLWHILSSCIHAQVGETTEAKTHAQTALNTIDLFGLDDSATILLYQARTRVYTDPAEAINLYLAHLRASETTTRHAWVELAVLMEAQGYVKTAWRVWRQIESDEWKTLVHIKRSFLQRENPKVATKCLQTLENSTSETFISAFRSEFNLTA